LTATINKQGTIASATAHKLALDVLTTRKHWYPKCILFIICWQSGNPSVEPFVILQSIRGIAIAVLRDKQAVADAMHLINFQYPKLKYTFHCLLATQVQYPCGWYIFLEAAAEKFARFYSFGDNAGTGSHLYLVLILQL
jgi:hypothetical protein